jgi:plastocyanin
MNRFLSRVTLAGALLVVALAAAACGSSAAQPTSPAVVDPNAVKIVASGQQFTTKDVAAPAGKAFQIAFESQTGDPHNIAIAASGAEPAFRSEVYTGPGTKTFDVQPLAAGTYTFKCDVHPGMEGTLTVR